MVGGVIIGICRGAESTLLTVRDARPGGVADECAVRCVERREDTGEAVELALGDRVWWQCGEVLWNPPGADASGAAPRWVNGRAAYDIPLRKVGYSH